MTTTHLKLCVKIFDNKTDFCNSELASTFGLKIPTQIETEECQQQSAQKWEELQASGNGKSVLVVKAAQYDRESWAILHSLDALGVLSESIPTFQSKPSAVAFGVISSNIEPESTHRSIQQMAENFANDKNPSLTQQAVQYAQAEYYTDATRIAAKNNVESKKKYQLLNSAMKKMANQLYKNIYHNPEVKVSGSLSNDIFNSIYPMLPKNNKPALMG